MLFARGQWKGAGVVVGGLSGRLIVAPSGVRVLVGFAVACWALVATMRYWWRWLWHHIGMASVPVDISVWVVAIVLTVLAVPALVHRFRHAWVVASVVGALVVTGTVVVLAPWHDVLVRAGMHTLDSRDLGSAPASQMVEPRM